MGITLLSCIVIMATALRRPAGTYDSNLSAKRRKLICGGTLFHLARDHHADYDDTVTYEAELIAVVSEHPSEVLAKGQLQRSRLSLDKEYSFQLSHNVDGHGQITRHWDHVEDHDWFKSIPAHGDHDWFESSLVKGILDKIVPFGLHGDDVQTFKRSSKLLNHKRSDNYKVLVRKSNFIMALLQAIGTPHWALWLMSLIAFIKDTALEEFWEFYNWSVLQLWVGRWPTHDWAGRPFT